MNLSAGTRLGPYEIVSPLRAGGMGEIYRANDTRLDRIGAILDSEAPVDPTVHASFCTGRTIAVASQPFRCLKIRRVGFPGEAPE